MINSILGLLCCPECLSRLDVLPTELFMGDVKGGLLRCPGTGRLVGVVENYKADFLHFDRNIDVKAVEERIRKGELPVEKDWEFEVEKIPFNDPRIRYTGAWGPLEDRFFYSEGLNDERASIEIDCSKFHASLFNHNWSGKVLLRVDNRFEREFDLYSPDGFAPSAYTIDEELPFGRHLIEVIPLGRKNSDSASTQVILGGFEVTTGRVVRTRYARKAENKGNPYPEGFLGIASGLPKDALILDCSGGNRQLGDDRYINFEYMKYELADVYGDGHCLPFKDNTFDLVLSQAVMEHLRDPFKGASEIYRVTKPGGLLWAEIAFMQPLHAVPYHFFNSTIWGIEELFKRFRKVESGCFGNLSVTFDWMIRTTSVIKNIGPERYSKLLETFRELDGYVTDDELRNIGSGVRFHGVKDPAPKAEE
ncbi:MAG: methyltransferase domain-containing protein [Deltaproteobacteria bacterium]|nr:methyltransferase domain-containing protein [Deltaproteobacteria bacterium]